MNSLASELAVCVKSKFTGRLDISTQKGDYRLYFGLGSLAWATGGLHPNRRWRRNLRHTCPEIDQNQIKFRQTDEMDDWEYSALVILLQRGIISNEQLLAIVTSYATEVLFDLIQLSVVNSNITSLKPDFTHSSKNFDNPQNQSSFKITPYMGIRPAGNHVLPRPLNLDLATTLAEVQQDWNHWVGVTGTGVVHISPNHVPIITRPEVLAPKITSKAYKNLAILTNGNYTIRDIAEVLQRKPWEVISSFLSHVRSGDMGLADMPDKEQIVSKVLPRERNNIAVTSALLNPLQDRLTTGGSHNNSPSQEAATFIPLVACIDDSRAHCDFLGRTLMGLGYDFMEIVNEIEALPLLITIVPDIIFLDLLMPIVNGYELCAQIRRVSCLKDVPVIILTSRNGVVDRVRAKIVGATDFVTKPVNSEQLLEILQKYGVIAQG